MMKQKGVTQRELAKMSGVTEMAMSRYMRGGRQPRAEVVANMATALGVTSGWLAARTQGGQAGTFTGDAPCGEERRRDSGDECMKAFVDVEYRDGRSFAKPPLRWNWLIENLSAKSFRFPSASLDVCIARFEHVGEALWVHGRGA